MKPPKTLDEIRARRPHADRAAIDAEKDLLRTEVALHTLREHVGVTQTAMAERLEVSRPRVHAIERAGEDLRLSTMERYVSALGGRLELRVIFEDQDPVVLDPHRTDAA
jgi:DNA-binding XRE family transcriptional regulator